jgi:hypothetical protein
VVASPGRARRAPPADRPGPAQPAAASGRWPTLPAG